MTRYVALLRGINVGGNTMIKMVDLKRMFEDLGFENVTSYINSGNLGFDTKKTSEDKLAAKIEKAIEAAVKKNISVMVREQTAIAKVLKSNPFKGSFESHKEMHVLFMKGEMPTAKKKELAELQTDNERCEIMGREIYLHLKLGFANSLLGRGLLEKKLKVPITARNWRTVEKLAEL